MVLKGTNSIFFLDVAIAPVYVHNCCDLAANKRRIWFSSLMLQMCLRMRATTTNSSQIVVTPTTSQTHATPNYQVTHGQKTLPHFAILC